MFIELRKDFLVGDPTFTLRSLLEEANVPITYSNITIKLRSFGFAGFQAMSILLFGEGPDSTGTPIPNVSPGGLLLVVNPSNNPTWVDTFRIGPSATGQGQRTLVMIIE
jgi:hypothetical protein